MRLSKIFSSLSFLLLVLLSFNSPHLTQLAAASPSTEEASGKSFWSGDAFSLNLDPTKLAQDFLSVSNVFLKSSTSMFEFMGERLKAYAQVAADRLIKADKQKKEKAAAANQAKPQAVGSQVKVRFINRSPHRASVFWDDDEELHRVVDVLAAGQSTELTTYVGHMFQFTREGTRDLLLEPVTIMKGKMEYILPKDAKPIDNSCADRYRKKCALFADAGECKKNPGWMIVNCPVSCNACELLDAKKRCDPAFLNVSADNVWKSGDLNAMFERILAEFTDDFNISVLGRPPDLPWVLQFNNFMTEDEVDVLVNWGEQLGYKRSTDTGEANERGEVTKIFSTGRTSSNAWCTGDCEKDPVVKRISDRIVNITHIPYNNYEQFQLLHYETGQFYRTHHDMSPKDDGKAGGVRILTFFLYLSDVEEGGETEFPRVKLKVKPKKGRAILWPSVLDEDPMKQDPRTYHAALPVKKGLKYAANHWIHSHDFKIANLWGCTGAFD